MAAFLSSQESVCLSLPLLSSRLLPSPPHRAACPLAPIKRVQRPKRGNIAWLYVLWETREGKPQRVVSFIHPALVHPSIHCRRRFSPTPPLLALSFLLRLAWAGEERSGAERKGWCFLSLEVESRRFWPKEDPDAGIPSSRQDFFVVVRKTETHL